MYRAPYVKNRKSGCTTAYRGKRPRGDRTDSRNSEREAQATTSSGNVRMRHLWQEQGQAARGSMRRRFHVAARSFAFDFQRPV